MKYTTRIGDRPTQAHVNYSCPCGCKAGLTYDREQGAEHLGRCCCGRLLWLGTGPQATVQLHFRESETYKVEIDEVSLPWGESSTAALAVPASASAVEKAKRDAGRVATKVVDPVCKMMIDPDDAAATSDYEGATYHFCATRCKTRFDADPARYAQTRSSDQP
jgi:YHS domain-containing protein